MKKDNRIKSYNMKLKDGKVFVASDLHFPYQDNKAIECFLKEVENKKPDMVVLNGDLLDFYRLSRFTKDPSGKDPAEEIEMCREFLHRLRSITDVPIYYTIGNHETRLEKYILDQAPMIACLMDNVFQVIKTEDIGVIGCSRLTINDNFVFEHGTRLGSKTGLSAIKELEAHYLSGATGHTHRLARYSTRKSGRRFIWLETGCLCDLSPEYMIDPDWEQGFGIIEFKSGRLKNATVVSIENGEII